MEPLKLEYRQPPTSTTHRSVLLHVIALGPLTGATIGVAQTVAAMIWWMQFGQPDFYFRGWDGVKVQLVTMSLAGAIIGVPYGLMLVGFERFTKRRIRSYVTIPLLIGLSFLFAMIVVREEFQRQELRWGLWPDAIAIGLGLLLSAGFSKPVP